MQEAKKGVAHGAGKAASLVFIAISFYSLAKYASHMSLTEAGSRVQNDSVSLKPKTFPANESATFDFFE